MHRAKPLVPTQMADRVKTSMPTYRSPPSSLPAYAPTSRGGRRSLPPASITLSIRAWADKSEPTRTDGEIQADEMVRRRPGAGLGWASIPLIARKPSSEQPAQVVGFPVVGDRHPHGSPPPDTAPAASQIDVAVGGGRVDVQGGLEPAPSCWNGLLRGVAGGVARVWARAA